MDAEETILIRVNQLWRKLLCESQSWKSQRTWDYSTRIHWFIKRHWFSAWLALQNAMRIENPRQLVRMKGYTTYTKRKIDPPNDQSNFVEQATQWSWHNASSSSSCQSIYLQTNFYQLNMIRTNETWYGHPIIANCSIWQYDTLLRQWFSAKI